MRVCECVCVCVVLSLRSLHWLHWSHLHGADAKQPFIFNGLSKTEVGTEVPEDVKNDDISSTRARKTRGNKTVNLTKCPCPR